MLQIPMDWAAIITALFVAATIALFKMLSSLVNTVSRIEMKLGKAEDPDSVLGKMQEFGQLRDWAIRQGFIPRGGTGK